MKINFIFIILSLFSSLALAQVAPVKPLSTMPAPFKIKEGVAIFIDIIDAQYSLAYETRSKKVLYRAILKFQNQFTGNPVFDVVKTPTNIFLDRTQATSRPVVTPDQETTLRVVNRSILPGVHELIIEGEITQFVEFLDNGGVKSAFWFNDQEDRSFLEAYLPTNLEYDQYSITMFVTQTEATAAQIIYTNGVVKPTSSLDTVSIKFPEYFNASAIYFHLVPEQLTTEIKGKFTSLRTHKVIPISIYTEIPNSQQLLIEALNKTKMILNNVENLIGPYPYDNLLINLVGEGQGGVEHVGAVVSEFNNLRHEIMHQYLSKGYMPANGNAGWIDEAIVTWLDKNRPRNLGLRTSYNLANQSPYTRVTDPKSYVHGVKFISLLNEHLENSSRGGLMPFLQYVAGNKIKKVYTTPIFIQEMEKFYNMPLLPFFKKYVY